MWSEVCNIFEYDRFKAVKVSIDERCCGGEPRLYATRITISNLLSYLQDGGTISEFAEDFDVEEKKCTEALLWVRNLLGDSNLKED